MLCLFTKTEVSSRIVSLSMECKITMSTSSFTLPLDKVAMMVFFFSSYSPFEESGQPKYACLHQNNVVHKIRHCRHTVEPMPYIV